MRIAAIVRTRRPRTAFTLVELLVVIAIIGILIAILLPALNTVRESGRRITCANNLRSLGEALHLYHDSYGIFPPGLEFDDGEDPSTTENFGRNWVIAVLPFIEQTDLYDKFDLNVPISDPKNRSPRGIQIATLLCPSDGNNSTKYSGSGNEGDNWGRGNYAANGGAGVLSLAVPSTSSQFLPAGIPGSSGTGWADKKVRGVMGPNESLRIDDVHKSDGSSKTILVGEIRAGLSPIDRRGVWAMGTAGSSSLYWYGWGGDDNGPNACTLEADDIKGCNAVIASLGQGAMQDTCMTCASSAPISAQQTVRSRHLGGAQVVMVGGNVHFISDFIETSGPYGPFGSVWDGLICSMDGLVFDDGKWNVDY